MELKKLADSTINRIIAFACAYILFGVVVFRWLEDFSWIDSLYYVVVTLATIGYGDVVPQTAGGKLFAVFYIIIGIVVFVTFGKAVLLRMMRRRNKQRKQTKKK